MDSQVYQELMVLTELIAQVTKAFKELKAHKVHKVVARTVLKEIEAYKDSKEQMDLKEYKDPREMQDFKVLQEQE
jgi:hypothetical protein